MALVALTVGLLAGCGSSNATPQTPAASPTAGMSSAATPEASAPASDQAQSTATIHISGFKFTTPATVSPGAMVSVMNMDTETHTVTADTGKAFDVKAAPGVTATFKAPSKPGTYPFHCTFHSNMHGSLVVK